MFSHVEQALEHLNTALDGIETAPSDLLRRTLGVSKQLRSRVELLEAKAAAVVAQRERHGDGGAGLLHEHSGLSRSDAARNVRTDTELVSIPDAHAALTEGQISLANAAKLARAARKTSPDAVQGDPELIGLAKTLPADEFAQAAQRWTARHQDAADLVAQHRRNRRNRNVRFWNGDDGSVQMRGSFDAEMGARIQNRLRHHAEQLRQADRRAQHRQAQLCRAQPQPPNAAYGTAADGAVDALGKGNAVRSRDQRMADALETLLAADNPAAPKATPSTAAPTEPTGQQPFTDNPPQSGHLTLPGTGVPEQGCIGETDGVNRSEPAPAAEAPPAHIGRKPAAAEIIVRADLAALTGEPDGTAELAAFSGQPGGVAEICGIGPIPLSTLARLACNSDVWVEIFGDKLTPLYETVASRAPTAAQRRALIARDGKCIGCGAPPGDCEAHHVIPWKCGGKTRVDNLVLVCWSCHDRIHDHNWQVIVRDNRFRLIPPDPTNPPNPAPSRKPKHRAAITRRSHLSRTTAQEPLPTISSQKPLPATTPPQAQPAA
ncbi:HNH endonuclease signature motif containing protein [Candidatus Poriferisodalis sp.]|uniref:HNH endonuclease signature motif containing protein n=1 Tax=Candidatus Poriferisodalis sp. TaxID=3101277 RepID=UPI003AF4F5DF